jgi:hypothetical protein
MAFQPAPILDEIDDHSALMSEIREAVYMLIERMKDHIGPMEEDEIRRILDAADLAQKKHLIIRRLADWHYKDSRRIAG